MDTAFGFDDERSSYGPDDMHDGFDDAVQVEDDAAERRMHVRAYNHWVSLLDGREYPLISELDHENFADFGAHSVLLDFTQGLDDPVIKYLGQALRDECSLDPAAARISQVPGRSLLSRLTDHYLQIIANRAPIGFEAEFVSTRGHNTFYRGILMPFASPGGAIDYIYGVINWKELVDEQTQAALDAEVAAAVAPAQRMETQAPIWADGPHAAEAAAEDLDLAPFMQESPVPAAPATGYIAPHSLSDQLLLAQQSAAAVRAADTRSRAALYRALGRAHDFALAADDDPNGYARLLAAAGISVQTRAPMTPVVKLVFGSDYDKTRLTEFATVLGHARASGVGSGELVGWMDAIDGGIKGIVALARAARVPARPVPAAAGVHALASRPAIASLALASNAKPGDYVVLVARAVDGGTLDIVAQVTSDDPLLRQVARRITD